MTRPKSSSGSSLNGVFFSFVSTHSTITIVSEHWIVVIILFFFVIFHYNPSCFSGTDLIDDIKPNAFCRQIASAEQKQSIRPDAEHSSGQNNIIQHAHSHNFKYIDAIKSALESVCAATVSCTDLLALAARAGVTMLGGPADIPMRTGRRDAMVSYYGEMERYLPVHNDTVSAVLSRFAPMGVDAVGVVALLGAHSVGRVHYFNPVVRLYPAVDGTIEPAYGAYLRERCPTADAVEDTRDVAYACDTSQTNPTKEIFSELDEINAQGLIFPRSFQKTEREVGRRGADTTGRRGPGLGRAALACGALASPLNLPFRLLKAFVAKPPVPRATIRKTFQRRAANPISGDSGDRLRHPAEGNHLPEMSHPWMYGNRCAPAFREGVNSFLLVAEANKSKQGFMCCPCLKCKNEKDYSCSRDIKSHLLRFGFMSSYNVWTKHGEEGVMMEDGDEEEDNDDQYRSMFSECFDTAMDDNEEEGGEEQASDDPVDDDLRRAISDARRDCGTDKERLQFDKMLEDHHKLLYPGCEDGHKSWVAYWNC
ncbi:hypothetical protein QYE76_038521 [Lolium multiflorum]|uniref:Plant heme peroxidase family profile domain-containing protein n=1 Tax=Lolium multiflorum TaxID=4521 RepID=A0AAD8WTN8_LOLMU|nr:hypothetical protein QYE76_038521 [Lolium multiflorum]